MIKIKGINKFANGFIVHYTITAACGCSYTSHTLLMPGTKKPTEKQAKQAIEDDLKNK